MRAFNLTTTFKNLDWDTEAFMHIQDLWEKANSLRGCLAHLKQATGRRRFSLDEDPFRLDDSFVGDEAKIVSSKAYRVMVNKTQVFTFPSSPLIRTRQAHVQEVIAVSVVASDMLGLNTSLVRAAAAGHDIGHVPFGHQGEAWMAKAMGRPEFCHEVMGPVIAQHIERSGTGLNLCHETLEAMMRHSGNMVREGMSQEAWLLRHTDKFTYIFHDVNDIMERARYPVSAELRGIVNSFGTTQRERTTSAMAALIVESEECGKVSFEHSDLGVKFKKLRELMYEVYPRVTQQNVGTLMEPVMEFLEQLRIGDPFMLLALMTDKDAAMIAGAAMKDMKLWNQTAISEITAHLERIGWVDLCDPDLSW